MKNLRLYALANEMNLGGQESGTIRVPFGRWDFGAKKLADGRTVWFVQELAAAGAEKIAAKVNASVAAGEKGVPVYWGHPDVPELAHKYPDKRAKGWIKSAAVEGGALVLSVEWLEEGATEGFGWFSPYWVGPARDLGGGRWLKVIEELISVALVNIPNIQEFRLANESQGNKNQSGADAGESEKNIMERAQLIQALGLPEAATDEEIVAAIEKLKAAAADAATKQEAAEAEKAQAVKEKDETAAALANERAARRGLLLDQAIAEGRISVAGRAAWEKRLAEDFAAGSVALANERAPKTESAVKETPAGRGAVNLVALANEKMKENPGMTYTAAFAQAMKEHPEVK